MNRRVATKAENVNSVNEDVLSVGPLVGRVRSVMLSTLDGELQRFGVTGTQYGVLKRVAEGSAVTAADLCRALSHDTGSMTRILDRLEEKGLIRRERSKEDRRVVSLRVTSTGRAALPRLRDIANGVVERMLGGFNPGEIDNLRGYLLRMIDNTRPGQHGH
jgi:DNA-binding MarR family transcriptional regulator